MVFFLLPQRCLIHVFYPNCCREPIVNSEHFKEVLSSVGCPDSLLTKPFGKLKTFILAQLLHLPTEHLV